MSGAELLALTGASIAVGLVVARTGRAVPRAPARPVRRPQPSAGPEPVRRLERAIEGAAWASELHLRLRPLLREIAFAALIRHGVDPDREPARAAALLGSELWELVRTDRGPPRQPFATGLDRDQVGALLSRLEAL